MAKRPLRRATKKSKSKAASKSRRRSSSTGVKKPSAPRVIDDEPEEPETNVDLGDIQVPEGEEAQQALRELAELNDRAIRANALYLEQVAKTKRAREKYNQLAEEVQTLLRRVTHGPELPLFDIAEREADQQVMEAAAGTAESELMPLDMVTPAP